MFIDDKNTLKRYLRTVKFRKNKQIILLDIPLILEMDKNQ